MYNKFFLIEFDTEKRNKTLLERGLDFARAIEVFSGLHFTAQDVRFKYEEDRFITTGFLDTRLVVLVWTPRGSTRRVISMRKGNDLEKALFAEQQMERS